MHFDTDGIYTLQYTAEDSCGNETVEERTVEVIGLKTTLFTDGTLIINEKSTDRNANVALHGAVTKEYVPMFTNGSNYVFSDINQVLWKNERASILRVEIGNAISPISTSWWFGMLQNCTSMDLSKMNTSRVTTMRGMFYYCDHLGAVDVSHFDTENVTDMGQMFMTCKLLTTLAVDSFDTSKVTKMNSMFSNCEGLQSLDISNFNTANVDQMDQMFNRCRNLGVIDVSNFDVSKVTSLRLVFDGCLSVQTLDLSNWDTSIVTNLYSTFNSCTSLTTIYASNKFVLGSVTDFGGTFSQCSTNLVGGAGTVWSPSSVEGYYAKIDGGTSDPGYFTAKS